jgi:hypothetical protein
MNEDEVRELVARKCAEVRQERHEEIEALRDVIEDLQEENKRLRERVGLSESRENGIPEDVPRIMQLEDMPVRDREARLSANKIRAVDVWSVWDVYADCGGEAETLKYSEIRRFLRSRNGGQDMTYQTAKRTAEWMVKLSEGMLRKDHTEDGEKRLTRVLSVDEWRVQHYEEKEEERKKREAEWTVEAKEEAEETFSQIGTAD